MKRAKDINPWLVSLYQEEHNEVDDTHLLALWQSEQQYSYTIIAVHTILFLKPFERANVAYVKRAAARNHLAAALF
ncbi:MAG: hypothetical protein J6C98_02880 [Oscillospiraceae bacterium]|nr:hypothetical protein [Oscillospiraceae bacterium]